MSKQLLEVKDQFTEEVATLTTDKEPETFGVNCGATFRVPVRLMSRIQTYLRDNYSVESATIPTTQKALQTLLISLGIVNTDEALLYFDTRKESAILEAQAKQNATATATEPEKAMADTTFNREFTPQEVELINKIKTFLAQSGNTEAKAKLFLTSLGYGEKERNVYVAQAKQVDEPNPFA